MSRLLLVLLALGGCARRTEVVIVGAPGADLDLAQVTFAPTGAAKVIAQPRRDRLVLSIVAGAALRVEHPGACPEELLPADARREVALRPLFDVGDDRPQLGYDAQFEVVVRAGCARGTRGEITWRAQGSSSMTLVPDARGFHLRGRTPSFRALHPWPAPWGVVPLSPASAGSTTLVATWRGADGGEQTRTLRVAAAARSAGLPSVPIGHRILLGGAGWKVASAPPEGRAAIVVMDGMATLTPDARGRWLLADGAHRELTLRVGRYDDTPLDCGRSECHAAAHGAAASSPMTSILARGLDGELRADYAPSCAIACHAIGEPGVADGGFTEVARELAFTLPARGAPGGWGALPRPLRRLGGVGCTACHGPGAIPEESGRWAILRADVCAVCHDAPPRYGHVAAWRTTRMSRADALPATRAPGCRTCHSTAGFLESIGVRASTGTWDPPAGTEPIGVTCAACHAAHGAHGDRALVRRVAPPAALSGAPAVPAATTICLRCHAPLDESSVSASAASLWLGRGGLDPQTGDARTGDALHLTVRDGCVGCHAVGKRAGAEADGRGHAMAVDRARCGQCHDAERPPVEQPDRSGKRVAERAAALFATAIARGLVRGATPGSPPHALAAPASPRTPVERALHNVRLVLEDPAAGVHNATYARALLADAEAILGAAR